MIFRDEEEEDDDDVRSVLGDVCAGAVTSHHVSHVGGGGQRVCCNVCVLAAAVQSDLRVLQCHSAFPASDSPCSLRLTASILLSALLTGGLLACAANAPS